MASPTFNPTATGKSSTGPEASAPPGSGTRTDELSEAISRGRPTISQIVDLYDLTIADLPGATKSSTPRGEGVDPSYVLSLVQDRWSELTPAQQSKITADRAANGYSTFAQDGTSLAAWTNGPPAVNRLRSTSPDSSWERFRTLFKAALVDLSRYHSMPMPDQFELVDGVRDTARTADMHTVVRRVPPDKWGCVITVTPVGRRITDDARVKSIFVHELFHCFQLTVDRTLSVPQWVFDGSADWVAYEVYRGSYLYPLDKVWDDWFSNPSKPLRLRKYDSWPLFEILHQRGVDVVDAVTAMLRKSGNDPAELLHAAGADTPEVLADWATRSVRATGAGPAWELPWVAPDPTVGPHNTAAAHSAVGLGTTELAGADEFGHRAFRVPFAAKVGLVTVRATAGTVIVSTGTGTARIGAGGQVLLCVDSGGCQCPAGRQRTIAPQTSTPPLLVTFTPGPQAGKAGLDAAKWDQDQYCEGTPLSLPPRAKECPKASVVSAGLGRAVGLDYVFTGAEAERRLGMTGVDVLCLYGGYVDIRIGPNQGAKVDHAPLPGSHRQTIPGAAWAWSAQSGQGDTAVGFAWFAVGSTVIGLGVANVDDPERVAVEVAKRVAAGR